MSALPIEIRKNNQVIWTDFTDKSNVALNTHLHVCGKTLQLWKIGLSEQHILTYIKEKHVKLYYHRSVHVTPRP